MLEMIRDDYEEDAADEAKLRQSCQELKEVLLKRQAKKKEAERRAWLENRAMTHLIVRD